eukprot:3940430-Rhodomonas_salina.1
MRSTELAYAGWRSSGTGSRAARALRRSSRGLNPTTNGKPRASIQTTRQNKTVLEKNKSKHRINHVPGTKCTEKSASHSQYELDAQYWPDAFKPRFHGTEVACSRGRWMNLSPEETKAVFTHIDKDGDGKIQQEEIKAAIETLET